MREVACADVEFITVTEGRGMYSNPHECTELGDCQLLGDVHDNPMLGLRCCSHSKPLSFKDLAIRFQGCI